MARGVFGTNVSGAALLVKGLSDMNITRFEPDRRRSDAPMFRAGRDFNTESAFLTVPTSTSMAEVVRMKDSTLVARGATYRGGTRAIDNDSGGCDGQCHRFPPSFRCPRLLQRWHPSEQRHLPSQGGVSQWQRPCDDQRSVLVRWPNGLFNVSADLTAFTSLLTSIHVTGVTPAPINGNWSVVSITAATIVVHQTVTPGTYSSGGSVFGGHDARADNDGRIWLQGATTTNGSAGVPKHFRYQHRRRHVPCL
ncbi:MAG: hypothetical protein WDN06_09995 [Asticcacaulis sp.]